MFPVIFEEVVGAVVAFEITLGYAWLRSRKKRDSSPPADPGQESPAAGTNLQDSADREPKNLPRAPALVIIGWTLLVSFLAFLVLFQFMSTHSLSRRGPGWDDVSAFDDDDIAHTDAWLLDSHSNKESVSLLLPIAADRSSELLKRPQPPFWRESPSGGTVARQKGGKGRFARPDLCFRSG